MIERLRQNLENAAKNSAIQKAGLPSEEEATDQSWERFILGLAIFCYAIVFISFFTIGLRQDTAVMLLMPSWLIASWHSARKKRLKKMQRRTEFFAAAAELENADS